MEEGKRRALMKGGGLAHGTVENGVSEVKGRALTWCIFWRQILKPEFSNKKEFRGKTGPNIGSRGMFGREE
jgi:hypothetical protein